MKVPSKSDENFDRQALSLRLDALREYVACLHHLNSHTQQDLSLRLLAILQPLQSCEWPGRAELLHQLEPWAGRRAGDAPPPQTTVLANLLDELADVIPHLDDGSPMLRAVEEPLVYLQDADTGHGQHLYQQLRGMGYRVQVFIRLDALQVSTLRRRPDILILGPAPAERQQALDWLQTETGSLPCILIDHDECVSAQLQAVRAGVQGHFIRPVHMAGLYQRLTQLLASEPGQISRLQILQVASTRTFPQLQQAGDLQVQWANDPDTLLAGLSSLHPELLLVDAADIDKALDWVRLVRLQDAWRQVPVLFYVDRASASPAVWQHADQVLYADIDAAMLLTCVRSQARRSRMLTQALTRDGLTGLLTQVEIRNRLGTEIERSVRTGKPLAVALLEIDHFEDIQATYGHLIGDMVLRTLAHLLRNRVRRTDLLGRYGSASFMILLTDCPAAHAQILLEDLRQKFAALSLHPSLQDFFCTFSAGMTCLQGQEGVDDLLMRLDAARLAARRSGPDRLCSL